MAPILQVKGISCGYGSPVLNQISFDLPPASRLAIIGETGSGKSTLLKAIGGYLELTAGQILFQGQLLPSASDMLIPGHKFMGYLGQTHALPKSLSVQQVLQYNTRVSAARQAQILRLCQVTDLLPRRTHEVSGGEQQRIALAMLLLANPEMLLLDEPYSNLDLRHKATLREVITSIGQELDTTILLIAHEPADLLPWARQMIALRSGKVVQQGYPWDLYINPTNEYVAGLLGPYVRVSAEMHADLKIPLATKFLRPENLEITASGNGTAGIITHRHYLGAFIDYEVSFPGYTVMARDTRIFEGGERVGVRWRPHAILSQ